MRPTAGAAIKLTLLLRYPIGFTAFFYNLMNSNLQKSAVRFDGLFAKKEGGNPYLPFFTVVKEPTRKAYIYTFKK